MCGVVWGGLGTVGAERWRWRRPHDPRGRAKKKRKRIILVIFLVIFSASISYFLNIFLLLLGWFFLGPRTVVTSGVGLFMQIVSPCHENPPIFQEKGREGDGGERKAP